MRYAVRNKAIIFLCMLITALFLCGCGKLDGFDVASSTSDEGKQQESDDGLHNPEKDLVSKDLLVSDYENLYDITSLLPGDINGTLVTYGLLSPKKICLLYNRRKPTNYEFFVKSLNLVTGEVEDISDAWNAENDGYGNAPYVCMLSASPMIFIDYTNNMLYRPENCDSIVMQIPFEHLGAGFTVYENELYSVEDNGLICRITEAGEFEPVFHVPESYNNVWLDNSDDSHYIAVNATTYLGDYVQVYIDPKSQKYKAYKKEDFPFYICGTWKDEIYGTDMLENGDNRIVSLCDKSSGTIKKLKLMSESSPQDTYLEIHGGSLCAEMLLLGFHDNDMKLKALYYWDSSSDTGEDWKISEKTEYSVPEVDEDELSEMADKIEDKYGIQIAYGENIVTEISDYTFEKCTNKGKVMKAMTTLDETFALYPEGMFERIENGFEQIVVYLTGDQAPKDASISISNSQGITTQENGFMMVLLDVDTVDVTRSIIVHEFTHVIDRKLECDGVMDEIKWSSMNPEDFEYFCGYVSETGTEYNDYVDVAYTSYYDGAYYDGYADTYFYDNYAKTWPTEDRARLMENLIGYENYNDPCFSGIHLQEKLEYYFGIIREDLGDDNWPEKTVWEEALELYKSK